MPCHRRHLCCLVSICPATVVTCAALKSKRPRSFWRCPSGDMPCHRRHLCLSGDMLCHRRHLCCLEIQAPALVLALSEWRYALPPSAASCARQAMHRVAICPATVVTFAGLKSKRPRSFWRCPSGDMPCHRPPPAGHTFVRLRAALH